MVSSCANTTSLSKTCFTARALHVAVSPMIHFGTPALLLTLRHLHCFRSLCERSPWWLFSWAVIESKSSSFITSITPRTPHSISAKPNTRRSCVNFAPSAHAPDNWHTPWRRFILRSTSLACPHIALSIKSPKVKAQSTLFALWTLH